MTLEEYNNQIEPKKEAVVLLKRKDYKIVHKANNLIYIFITGIESTYVTEIDKVAIYTTTDEALKNKLSCFKLEVALTNY